MSTTTNEQPLVTEPERQRLYRAMEEQQPELWRKLYPRAYPEPPTCGEYYSAEDPAHFFLWQYHRADHDVEVAEQPLMAMAASLMDCGMPMMWLSPIIVETIKHTFPRGNLDWTTMVLPHASMVMMVPRGTLVHPTEGDVPFIAYSRIGYIDPDGGCERVFLFLAYTRQYSCLVQLSGDTPIVTFTTITEHAAKGGLHPATVQGLDPAKDHATLREAVHLLFGALLIMTARPDLSQKPKLLRRIEGKKECWSCQVLGEHYGEHNQVKHEPLKRNHGMAT
jgi:hypothetical protein